MKRFVVLLLSLVLAACGRGSSPAKCPDNLVVGKAQAAPAADKPAVAPEDDLPIPIGEGDAVRGDRDAYVTIVVFSDFQCPFCGRLVPTLDRLIAAHGPDEVRIVFKHNPLPFHDKARLAAEAAQGVLALGGSEAFWRFHDALFRNQRDLELPSLLRYAKEAGVDAGALQRGLDAKRWSAKVDADMELAERLGANGTPCSFINGRKLSGAQPLDKFEDILSAELEAAKSLVERGVARDKVYRRLLVANYKEEEPESPDEDADSEPDTTVWKIPVGASPARGSADALVTIVEFGDFQCPYCKRVRATLDEVKQTYGDKVRVVWKDQPLPFHPRAEPAAQLARAARAQKGDAGFWAMHDALFDAQPKLEDADLEAAARKVGLDVKKAMSAVASRSFKKQIDADESLADDVQASGTPHFFVNGRRLVGAQPIDKWKALLDEEIVKAEARVKGGTAKAALYDAIIKDGRGAPEPERRSLGAAPTKAPFRGAANAKVVIQMMSDFQCPFCARVEPTIAELLKAYPGKIKVVWRDKPLTRLHPDAALAAEAAREAYAQKGNAGWLKMHDVLFANQKALKRADLEGYAAQIGLDMTRFKEALDARTHKPLVDADDKASADAGVSGTPAFTIGPFYLSGAQPLAKFKKLVDKALVEPATPAAKTAAKGLAVKDVTVGTGRAVKNGDKVEVHYVGTLSDGTEFDSSKKRGAPFSFVVGRGAVIKGWEAGIVGMKVGGERKLTIPPDLAYGDRGVGGVVPAGATLQFDIELLSIQ